MSWPNEKIEVACPKCGETFEGWYRPSHEPAASSQSALAYVAHLANALAYRAGFGGGDGAGGEIAAGALEFLKMDAAELDPLQAEMTEAIGGLEAALPGA